MADALKQRFNDDLLLEDEDQNLARKRYPSALFSVLYFEDLCTFFKKHDSEANQAKRKLRRAGTRAIFAGVLALFAASAAPLIHPIIDEPWPAVIRVLASLLGIASVVIGLFGVGSTKNKQIWLLNRLMTERLRQFQLQTLVCRIPNVLDAMEGCEGVVRYILERNKWWASFKARHEDHLRARLQGVLDDVAEDDVWLHEAEFSDNRFDEPEAWDLPMRSGEHLTELFRAYGDLRFDHQIQYADFKLEKRTAWLANIVVEIRLGTHTPAHKSPTVLEAGEAWIAQAETEGLERSTIVAYRQLLDLHVRPFLGHLKLAELTPGAVQNFRTVLIRNGRSRTMADRVVSGLGSILAEAMAGGRVARNVVREQAQHNRRRARVEKRHATRPQVLEHAGRLRPLLVTAVFTGLRASELRGLAWSAVDLDRKIVTVRQRADRCRTIGSPKSASAKREIPLASIGSTRRANGGWPAPRASSTWSSRTAKGGSNTTSTSIAGGSGRCRSPPGSRPTRGTRNGLHSLRHAAASLFIEQSFSPKRVQALMGHSTDVRSLARTAVASGQPRSRRNADLLALNPFREIPDRHPGDLRVRPWKTLSRRRKARGRGLPKRGTLV